jgi:hypothetical protein
VLPFATWFLLGLWSAETLATVCGLPSVAPLAFVASLFPALLVRHWLARYRLERAQRASAGRAQPPPPPPEPPTHAPPPPRAAISFPLLRLHAPFSRAELTTAFHHRSMELHPDHGGDTATFRMLLAERKRALQLAR